MHYILNVENIKTQIASALRCQRVKVKLLSLCWTYKALRHEGVWGCGCIVPHLLDLGISWSGQLHAPAALTPGRSPWYPLDRRLGRPQSRSGRHGEVKILDSTGTRTPTSRSSSPWPVAITTALSAFILPYLFFLLQTYLSSQKPVISPFCCTSSCMSTLGAYCNTGLLLNRSTL
jgi:hypothetical protein